MVRIDWISVVKFWKR